jgi:hypothetical protein
VAAIERSGLAPGRHRIVWDGAGAASGVYILRVQAGPERSTRKIVLMR